MRGFSLMEIMVALVIFSVISVGASGVLTNLQRSQGALDEHSAQLETLQRMIMMSHHDISQAAANVRTENGQLTFTALNWRNPLGDARSTLATVRYAIDADSLLRQVWPVAVPVQADPSLRQVLAEHIQALRFRSVFPANATAQPAFPAAIEMTVTLPPFGEVSQLIPLVQTP